jgi:hypothetical protein
MTNGRLPHEAGRLPLLDSTEKRQRSHHPSSMSNWQMSRDLDVSLVQEMIEHRACRCRTWRTRLDFPKWL